jgi:hypothetical protein
MSAGRSAVPPAVLTIGHSNHPLDRFLALLARGFSEGGPKAWFVVVRKVK